VNYDEARALALPVGSASETYRNLEYIIRKHAPKNLTDLKLRRKWRLISAKEKEAIRAAVARGETYAKIGAEFGRNDGQIAKILREHR
jgi:hypothetical protein